MNNNFNLKQYLSENILLGEIEIGMGSSQLKKLFDINVKSDRETIKDYPPEDPEVVDEYEQVVQNANYNTIEEFAEFFNDSFWVMQEEYETDFGDQIGWLIKMCKEINFKSTKDLIKACINVHYEDYNDEEKEEEFNYFEDELEGLNEIEVSFGDIDRYYLTPLAEAYLSYLPDRYDDISRETGDEDIANFLSYIKVVLDLTGKNYVSYNSAYEVWHDMLFEDYDTPEYKEAVDGQFDECLRLGLLTK
jgi:hypothetical protein